MSEPIKPAGDGGEVARAFMVLTRAMRSDPDYAWSWHCNIAMSFYDVALLIEPSAERHKVSNEAAARFMKQCFGADTSKHPRELAAIPEEPVSVMPDAPESYAAKD
jgi:hypothetical protein